MVSAGTGFPTCTTVGHGAYTPSLPTPGRPSGLGDIGVPSTTGEPGQPFEGAADST